MIREIRLSKRAERKLSKLLEYLEKKWSREVKQDFIKKLDHSFDKINQYPESFPKTDFVKGLYKCVITRQTTIYYKYDDTKVDVVTLFDSRQDPEKLRQETK